MKRVTAGALLALVLLAGAPHAPASARPFTVEDLLRQESFGAVAIGPSGRWVVFEQRGSYAGAPRFDDDQGSPIGTSRLFIAKRGASGPARPLLPGEAPGQLIGAIAPSGERLAVYQFHGGDWRVGVVELSTGTARWLDVRLPKPHRGRLLQWRSDTEVLVVDRGAAPLTTSDRIGRVSAETLPRLWAETASGRGAHTVVGSGAYRSARPRPSPWRLVRINLKTDRKTEVARGEIVDFELAPGGAHVAFRTLGEDIQSRLGRAVQGDWGVSPQVETLQIADLQTARIVTPCGSCDVLPSLMAWSPAGAKLLFFGREGDRPWSAGRLRSFDVRAARGTVLDDDAVEPVVLGRPEIVRADWMGEIPIFIGRRRGPGGRRADWFRWDRGGPIDMTRDLVAAAASLVSLDESGFSFVVQGQVWSVAARGEARRLDAPPAALAASPLKTRDGRPLTAAHAVGWVATTPEEGDRRILAVGSGVQGAGLDLPRHGVIEAVSDDGRGAVVRIDRQGYEARLEWLGQDGPGRVLAEINTVLADTDPADIRAIRHPGPDGQPLTSWLYLPPRRGGPPPPLIVKVYSGDNYRVPPPYKAPVLGLQGDTRVLLGEGFAVLAPSLPRPIAHDGPEEPARGLAARILAIVDLAARDPALVGSFDPDRLALWGHSYGGYTVMATITQTDRFRAAVAVGGYADLVAKWASLPTPHRALQDEGVRSNYVTGGMESGQGRMRVPPWSDRERYVRNSPLLQADAITTPLLLAHGDQDGAVPLTQSEAMFSALYRQNKDALLVTYWGEGHYISSPGNVRDLYARVRRFLDTHLTEPARIRETTPQSPGHDPASSAPRLPPAPR